MHLATPADERDQPRRLAALDADVIGLQEVLAFGDLPNQADEIAAGLGWNVYHAPAWQIGGGLTFGNAILSPHRLFDTECLALPSPPGLDTRSAVFARVDAPHGPIPVFATHLTVQFHLCHVRRQQVVALADHVARLFHQHLRTTILAYLRRRSQGVGTSQSHGGVQSCHHRPFLAWARSESRFR
jgi:endonuclease/exonuclease/phosphatase family metal-dependent hydrolase